MGNRSFGGKLVFQLPWQLLWRVTQRQLGPGTTAVRGPRLGSQGGEGSPDGGARLGLSFAPLPPRSPSSPSPPFLFPFFAGIHSICGAPGRTGKCRRRLQFPDKVSRTRNIFRLTRRNTGSVWGETQGPTCRNPKPSLEKTKYPLLAFRNILLDQNIPRHRL